MPSLGLPAFRDAQASPGGAAEDPRWAFLSRQASTGASSPIKALNTPRKPLQ